MKPWDGLLPGPGHILLRGVNWLGDAVMTTPAIRRLQERFPAARFTLWTSAKLADLWRGQPGIAQVLAFDAHDGFLAKARRLREIHADLAVIFPNSPRSAAEAWWAGIPERAGFRGGWRAWLLTIAVNRRPEHVQMRKRSAAEVMRRVRANVPRTAFPSASHQVRDYLEIAAALGGNREPLAPAIEVSQAQLQAAAEKFGLQRTFPGAQPLIGLNAGAEYGPAKRWPLENFVSAAALVARRVSAAWLLLGGKADLPAAQKIEGALRAGGFQTLNLAGQTSLCDLAALLRLCRAVVTNDTGPMHLAAAVGTTVVVPFGSTAPELTGPGLPGNGPHQLLIGQAPCAPCFRRECPLDLRCLKSIEPRQAAEALWRVLAAK